MSSAMKKLEELSPSNRTIADSVEVEELSMKNLKNMLKTGDIDKDTANLILKAINTIGKIRINQRSEVSIKARMIKDYSANQEEMKMYIEATFPKMFTKHK